MSDFQDDVDDNSHHSIRNHCDQDNVLIGYSADNPGIHQQPEKKHEGSSITSESYSLACNPTEQYSDDNGDVSSGVHSFPPLKGLPS